MDNNAAAELRNLHHHVMIGLSIHMAVAYENLWLSSPNGKTIIFTSKKALQLTG
jgi:hypothetical protein